MEDMIFRVKNEKARQLVHDLAELDLVEIVHETPQEQPKEFILDKFWGILTPEQGADLHKHIEEIRNEWDHRDIS